MAAYADEYCTLRNVISKWQVLLGVIEFLISNAFADNVYWRIKPLKVRYLTLLVLSNKIQNWFENKQCSNWLKAKYVENVTEVKVHVNGILSTSNSSSLLL